MTEMTAGSFVRLRPCPDKPNCVSSQANPEDETHFMPPVTLHLSAEKTIEALVGIMKDMPRSTLIEQTPHYVHVEFRSRVFRFVDDVEFALDTASNTLHFRSAARKGYSDMGVNRKRMTEILAKLQSQ